MLRFLRRLCLALLASPVAALTHGTLAHVEMLGGLRPCMALVYEALSEEWRKRDGEISDPWANDEADGYQPPSYEPVNPELSTKGERT